MSKTLKILAAGVAAWLLLPKRATGPATFTDRDSYLGFSNLPRGIRNNNPGNLKISSSPWRGKIPPERNTDGTFEQFQNYAYGLRAMIKLLLNYMGDGKTTIRQIIRKYAPSTDNNTEAYVQAVSQAINFLPDTPLPATRTVVSALVRSMARHENGMNAVTQRQLNEAWNLI